MQEQHAASFELLEANSFLIDGTEPERAIHYQLALEAAQVGIWDWLLESNQLTWSKECKLLFGLTADAPLSLEQFIDLVHPEDRAHVNDLIVKLMTGGTKNFRLEYRVTLPDQQVRWLEVRGQVLYNERGYATQALGIIIDVSKRKQAEMERQEALREAFTTREKMTNCFFQLDRHWRFTYLNPQAEALAGRKRSELIGRNMWEEFPGLVGTVFDQQYRKAVALKSPVHFEAPFVSHVGDAVEERWFDVHAYHDADGGLSIYYQNKTELRQAELQILKLERQAHHESQQLVEELEQERAQLQAVMDQAALGIIIVEAPSGKIIFYNEESTRLLGHPLLESNDYTEYVQYHAIHEDGTPFRAEEYPTAKSLLSNEVIRDEHLLYQFSNGTLRHLSVSTAPVHNHKGDIVSVVCTFYDISEQYELSKQKDEFISIVSHELKTPLTTIKANLQLAERRLKRFSTQLQLPSLEAEELKQAKSFVERALRQVEVQKRLINDLVDASRIQADKLQLSVKTGNLVDLVSTVVEDQRLSTPNRVIELELPKERAILLDIDEDRISQVLSNYLSNAIKYAPASEPIQVGVTLKGQVVQVWVKDRGPGLAPKDQEQVWERFYQVKGRHVQQDSGGVNLGLGLHICRELILLHGGMVGVESVPGEGARFWFELTYQREKE